MFNKIIKYIRSIRWFEIFVRCGAPLLGVVFSIDKFSYILFFKIFLLILSYFLLWSHIYIYNELKGKGFDLIDTFKKTPLLKGEVSNFSLFNFSMILLFFSIILFYLLNPFFLIFAFVDLLMGITYVHPKTLLKNKPFISIIFLFIANFNAFLIGWLLFSRISIIGILIGVYFGILGAAGQLIHEVKDFEADKLSGIKTNAIRFGKKKLFLIGIFTYTFSVIYFTIISIRFLNEPYYIPLFFTYPLYLYGFIMCFKKDLDRKTLHNFVIQYRIIYIIIGISILVLCLDI